MTVSSGYIKEISQEISWLQLVECLHMSTNTLNLQPKTLDLKPQLAKSHTSSSGGSRGFKPFSGGL